MITTVFFYAMALLPAVVIFTIGSRPVFALALICAASVMFPVGLYLTLPIEVEPDVEVHVVDPGGTWSRAECRGKGGVLLLFKDTRRGNPVRWWVKCRDGSKAGVVTKSENPPALGTYEAGRPVV